ncbi:MAG: hypothetical protein ACK4WF_08730, partial [Candidatus Brocadiales bacterium]
MEGEKPTLSQRFKLGIALIIGSTLCGYAALAIVGEATVAHNPRLRAISLVVWFLTWIPFLGGLALSGKEGYGYAKRFINER